MNFWTTENIRQVIGGTWLRRPVPGATGAGGAAPVITDGLSTDTRTLRRGQVFLALRGENFDGHNFLMQAAVAGAPLLIVDDPERSIAAWDGGLSATGVSVLHVKDTRRALGKLASAYRGSVEGLRVVAVTGSSGKTTTTRLIDAVLRTKMRGSASRKSFNNDIGVPLTLLSVSPADRYLVAEVGMNHAGEIAPLAAMLNPDAAVITCIGRAHIEHLGSREAIANEKAALLGGLREGGLAVLPADEPLLAEHAQRAGAAGATVATFGAGVRADFRLTAVEHAPVADPSGGGSGTVIGLKFTVGARSAFTLPMIGHHNAMNALAAIAIGRRFGLSDAEIAQGLAACTGPEMRLDRRTIGGIEVINDAYNANPESMVAAVRTFADVARGAARRVVVIGDMFELGAHAREAHEEVARAIAEAGNIDVVVGVGQNAAWTVAALAPVRTVRTHAIDSLDGSGAGEVAALVGAGDTVLLKGSRRAGLERVVKELERRAAESPKPPSATVVGTRNPAAVGGH